MHDLDVLWFKNDNRFHLSNWRAVKKPIKLDATGLLGPQSIKNNQSYCRVTTVWSIII